MPRAGLLFPGPFYTLSYSHFSPIVSRMSKYILDNLFGSKARVKVLKFLFRNYPAGFTVRQIAHRTQESALIVRRELDTLRKISLIKKAR